MHYREKKLRPLVSEVMAKAAQNLGLGDENLRVLGGDMGFAFCCYLFVETFV